MTHGRCRGSHPSRRSFGTARRIRMFGSHLGSTLGSGKSCPDPGRLSTFGVSGLYPCRRLTYRGACGSIVTPPSLPRQTLDGSLTPAPVSQRPPRLDAMTTRSEEHTSELQSRRELVCRLL